MTTTTIWATTKLKRVTTKIGSGATPRGGKEAYHENGMPLVRSLNVYDLNFSDDDLAFINDQQANQLANVAVEKDDVLLNITGASVCRCTSVPDRLVPARVNQHVSIIRADRKNLDGKFLKYALVSPLYKSRLWGLARTGATREALTKVDIENFELRIPNIKTQIRIASALSAYDDLIENNEKRITALEEMAQLLYTEWFLKFKFPGHKKIKMIDSKTEYGLIPEGWDVRRLAGFITPQYGYTASATSNELSPKYLRGMDINKKSYIDWAEVPNCEINAKNAEKYKVRQGDVFIIRMADPGKIGICEADINAVFASYLIRLKIKEKLTPYYLYYFVNSQKYQSFILGASNGATRKSINSQQVGAINIIIPSPHVLVSFEDRICQYRDLLEKLISANNSLKKIRDYLIPQLVTGRREIKN